MRRWRVSAAHVRPVPGSAAGGGGDQPRRPLGGKPLAQAVSIALLIHRHAGRRAKSSSAAALGGGR